MPISRSFSLTGRQPMFSSRIRFAASQLVVLDVMISTGGDIISCTCIRLPRFSGDLAHLTCQLTQLHGPACQSLTAVKLLIPARANPVSRARVGPRFG